MKKETKKVRRRRYDASFKTELLELHANGRSIRSLSESFGINENLLYKYLPRDLGGKKLSNASSSKEKKEESQEIKQLRKRLKEVEQERDILKKASGIFSRHP